MLRNYLIVLALAAIAYADDESCIQCHSNPSRLKKVTNGDEQRARKAFVDAKLHDTTAHGGQGCSDCHFDFEGYPHQKEGPSTAGCVDCHDDEAAIHADNVHGQQTGDKTVSCSDCHGTHDVFKAAERPSRLHPLNVTRTCGKCHFDDIDAETATVEELLEQRFCDDSHGRGLLLGGLIVAPTCVTCHGTHDTKAKGDPESRVSRKNVSATCGACHTGVREQYELSVHAIARKKNGGDGEKSNGDDAATCTDCHQPHTVGTRTTEFRVASVARCGSCHQQKMDSYQNSYHGKVTSLGYGGVADCAGCHGAHSIRASSDVQSRVHPDNLVKTCGECHEGAHESFVEYKVHAVWDGGDNSDAMLRAIYLGIHWLLLGAMGFALLHVVLWLVRATLAGEWKKRPRSGRTVRRWRTFYIQLHVVFMCSFILLAATGLPLHYAAQPWARRLMLRLGGAEAAGWVHRVSAIVMLSAIAVYLVHIAIRFFVRREKGLFTGHNTLLPRWKDVTDLLGNMRWFLFLGKQPRFDRWCYWEKFDFWAVFWGIAIIGASGLVLWFPVAATKLMPGWLINVANIVHGGEALLAVAFIFTFHVFHANLRPDKFPIDPLFLTGRMDESEMKHDRPMEYDRMVADGTLDDIVDEPPLLATTRFAYLLGGVIMISGIILVILMWTVAR